MGIALACEQISDSFCLATKRLEEPETGLWFKNSPKIHAFFVFYGVFLSFQALPSCRRI